MESKEVCIKIFKEFYDVHINNIKKFEGFISNNDNDCEIVIKVDSFPNFMKLWLFRADVYLFGNIFLDLLKSNNFEVIGWFLDSYTNNILNSLSDTDFSIQLQRKEIRDFHGWKVG